MWKQGEGAPLDEAGIVAEEIRCFLRSEAYRRMAEAEQYYRNRSDVQRKRCETMHRSNTRIEHPILKKLVDQKADYVLGKPFTVQSDAAGYAAALEEVFCEAFRRRWKGFGKQAVKSGIAFLQPYFHEGRLKVALLPPTEVIPLWEDGEGEVLAGFIRFFEQEEYVGRRRGARLRAEWWTKEGVRRFAGPWGPFGAAPRVAVGRLAAEGELEPHFTFEGQGGCFGEVPLVWLRYNEEELGLCYYLRELIDDINWQTSVTADALRDIAKFIYVLRNYGGQDLGEFVREVQEHLAIKVDGDGGVDKLQAEVNIDAVMAFLKKNYEDVIYYASGVDTRDPALGNASGSAIHFRYMDLDNDCQALAGEMQAAFARLKGFIDLWLRLAGYGDFRGERFRVVFNMDMPVNEGEVIQNACASEGILSARTILENHPWVSDAQAEMQRLEDEGRGRLDGEGA